MDLQIFVDGEYEGETTQSLIFEGGVRGEKLFGVSKDLRILAVGFLNRHMQNGQGFVSASQSPCH